MKEMCELRDQAEVFAFLDRLDAPVDLHLLEQARGVRLHRVLGDEELLADLAVAQPLRDVREDLVLARGEADFLQLLGVEDERSVRRAPALRG